MRSSSPAAYLHLNIIFDVYVQKVFTVAVLLEALFIEAHIET